MSVSIRPELFPVGAAYRVIYSHGVETRVGAGMLQVSSQVGETSAGHLPSNFRGYCEQALTNLASVLVAGLVSPNWLLEIKEVAGVE